MTTMIESQSEIIKTDSQGRLRMSAERRESLLAEFERSGLSGAKFAALMGIKYQTFAVWMRRRRKGGPAVENAVKPAGSVRWLEAVVEQAQLGGGGQPLLTLQLPGGARLEIASVAQVELAAALLRSLAKPC